MTVRVSDFALIIGHVWRCTACRDALLENPSLMGVGYKLTEAQRECIAKITEEDFRTMMHLAEVTGLTLREIEAAVDHPRARLRHLGSIKGELRPGLSW
ncbi:MAG: hypothetical protein NZ553_17000 [Caldilinea sp.]|jgi:hypothetical protein|uniref:Uncharacterized protein n=1 Tax=Candidatus Thermofonsia Clade 3 bacterium TaxID=2364212 RepID=A0A2M8Q8V4_9CHLR|nr:hypothetical protein [Caldilinea sp.]MCS6828316.1 hypothetical protein [Caldilinea sp.]MDW8442179.1 hypothetical protein [Caldilineaceae bacterium]PJF46219.1 MAG: hypothetical protein CUN48_14915 [Candidatus Thermofonsia Clade 3 bacterium]GIV70215.1 MAG: hypothetical protein KatS3mg048_3077 [Caldilinea sp.]